MKTWIALTKLAALALVALAWNPGLRAQGIVAECAPFDTVGAGPDIVLIPGLGSSPQVWDSLVDRLRENHRVHRVHIAGFAGRPASGPPETLLDRSAQEIIGQLDCLGVEDATVIGHSLGGFLGLQLALDHPDRIRRLVVVDALPFYPLIFSQAATVETARPQADAFRSGLLEMSDAAFETSQRSGVRSLVRSREHHDTVVGWSLASDRATFAGAIHTLMTTDLREDLGRIETPTVILAAVNAFAPRARVEPLFQSAYAELDGVDIRIVEDSYHFIMFDQAELFEEEVLGALSVE